MPKLHGCHMIRKTGLTDIEFHIIEMGESSETLQTLQWDSHIGKPKSRARFNLKISSYRYGDFHVKDKTVLRRSHL